MLKALGLGRKPAELEQLSEKNQSAVSLAIMDDALTLEEAFIAMDMVMDDRSNEALKLITENKENKPGRDQSAFYKLVIGVIYFIEATLGFEPESIRRASEALAEAEAAAVKDRNRAQRNGHASKYSKYPPGTEYRVAFAEAELMGAITLFLSESYLESVKALYKLRKAYQTLDEISRSIREANGGATKGSGRLSKKTSLASLKSQTHRVSLDALGLAVSDDQEMAALTEKFQRTRLHRLNEGSATPSVKSSAASTASGATTAAEALHQGSETIEEFIESGVDLCFGILQLVISIIPPTLGKILSVVGFRGSRDGGLALLWEATQYRNIHGALALLVLLQFYDGPTQFSDLILPDTEEDLIQKGLYDVNTADDTDVTLTTTITGGSQKRTHTLPKNPRRRMHKLLLSARQYYPHSALWMLQQGRMEASQCHLEEAVSIMDDKSIGPIEMKQVEALMLFDKTMFMLFLNRYEQSATNFIRLIDINAWSHAWYTYVAATCSIEIYRQALRSGDAAKAKEAKARATKLLEEAPGLIGKKKLMAKTMPMDVFLSRKIAQMQELAKTHKIDLVDAAGVSPVQEVVYFWNGYGKMPDYALEKAISVLGYSGAEGTELADPVPGAPVIPEEDNEKTVRYLLQAVALRNLNKVEEGYKLLNEQVISQLVTKTGSRYNYIRSHHKDPWMPPSALYERAMFEWVRLGPDGSETVREWLTLAEKWADDYELSTRVGMKIKSAFERLDGVALV